MAAPSVPTGLALTAKPGILEAKWNPSSGSPATYVIDWSNDSGFAGYESTQVPASSTSYTIERLTPGVTYYVRVRAFNSASETSAYTSTASAAVPGRNPLSGLRTASLQLDGMQIEVRSDGINASPTYTLGFVPFGPDVGGIDDTFTTIDVLSTSGATGFDTDPSPRAVTLATDPSGNIYVIGTSATDSATLVVRRYVRTGSTSWAAGVTRTASVEGGNNGFMGHAAIYVTGTGSSPQSNLLVVSRRHGSVTSKTIVATLLNPAAFTGSTPLLRSFVVNPTWLSYPNPATLQTNNANVDIVALGGSQYAVLGNDSAIITVINGKITSVVKTTYGAFIEGPFARLVPLPDGSYMVIAHSGANLNITRAFANGAGYASSLYLGANAFGSTFATEQFDAWYDRREDTVKVVYLADDSQRKLEQVKYVVATRTLTGPAVLSSTFGPPGTTNGVVRAPSAPVDERRVIIETAALVGTTKSLATYSTRVSDVAPNAPGLTDKEGFDAGYPQAFTWAFSDPNPADKQRAYELEVQRISDSTNVYAPGKALSAVSSATVPASTLVNGVDYRWRVRVYDQADQAGPWSSYDVFTTAALGMLTITSPATNDQAGIEDAGIALAWSYTQPDGYVQTQRRIRVIRDSTGVTISDTGMQASTATSETTATVPSDVRVRIELSIKTNAPGAPTITATRYLTSSYALPMTPTVVYVIGPSYIEAQVTNPTPTGSRPATAINYIERRLAGTTDQFVEIGSAGPNGSYRDYTVASDTGYEYRVRGVIGDFTAFALSAESTQGSAALLGMWLHYVSDPQGTIMQFLYSAGGRTESLGVRSSKRWLQGRPNPVVEYGDAEESTLTVSAQVVYGDGYDESLQWWTDAARSRETLLYRDNRGRVLYTTLSEGVDFTEDTTGVKVSAKLPTIDYVAVI